MHDYHYFSDCSISAKNSWCERERCFICLSVCTRILLPRGKRKILLTNIPYDNNNVSFELWWSVSSIDRYWIACYKRCSYIMTQNFIVSNIIHQIWFHFIVNHHATWLFHSDRFVCNSGVAETEKTTETFLKRFIDRIDSTNCGL